MRLALLAFFFSAGPGLLLSAHYDSCSRVQARPATMAVVMTMA